MLPSIERWTEELGGGGERRETVAHSKRSVQLVFPETAALDGQLTPQQRHRGIFSVTFYDLQATWSGRFPKTDAAALPHSEKNSTIEPLPPFLAFTVSDVRGLQGRPVLTLGGAPLGWQARIPEFEGRFPAARARSSCS